MKYVGVSQCEVYTAITAILGSRDGARILKGKLPKFVPERVTISALCPKPRNWMKQVLGLGFRVNEIL